MEGEDTKLKVLILDDERLVRFTIGAYLRTSGYFVTEATTPEEAVLKLKREEFHAIVSDVVMGEVDGFMFRDLVRTWEKDIPIIFLTSMMNDSGNAFLERVTEDVHSYYVSKAAPRTVLVARLNQVVNAYLAELNVRRMEKRLQKNLELASFVQKAMLPTWVHIGKYYTYASCFEPFAKISGDLYEWYPIKGHSALFIIGDIAGHGTNAALAMTAVQAFLKQFSYVEEEDAQRVYRIARSIHDFIQTNLKDVTYMATTILYVNYEQMYCRYINCGNPEPLCISSVTGELQKMNPEKRGAMPLGLLPEAEYRAEDVVEYHFSKEEVFLLSSDGIYDVSSDPEGNDLVPADILFQLFSIVVRERGNGETLIGAIPYRIISSLDGMGFSHKHDDVSFCVIGANENMAGQFLSEVKMYPDTIDEICHKAKLWIAENTQDEELAVKVDLLLNEQMMNIYRHGYNDFDRQHEVSILSMHTEGGNLIVTVWDRGAPWRDIMDKSITDVEKQLDKQNENLADNGRGLAILRKIAENITIERFMNLNKTVFYIPMKKGGDK